MEKKGILPHVTVHVTTHVTVPLQDLHHIFTCYRMLPQLQKEICIFFQILIKICNP